MFSHNQILIDPKSYGLVHDVCVKKICVCCTVLMKNYFDPLWYGHLGLGMTRAVVNVEHVVYSKRNIR